MEVLGRCPWNPLRVDRPSTYQNTRMHDGVHHTQKERAWIRDEGEEDTCHVPRDEPLLVFVVALFLPTSPGDCRRRQGLREGRRCIASPVRSELVRRHRLTPVLTDRTKNLAGHRGRRVGQGAGVPEVAC